MDGPAKPTKVVLHPPPPAVRRASPKQLIILNALYARATHPAGQSISDASKETGLPESWIRNWLIRARSNSKRRTVGQSKSGAMPKSTPSSTHSTQSEPTRKPSGNNVSQSNDVSLSVTNSHMLRGIAGTPIPMDPPSHMSTVYSQPRAFAATEYSRPLSAPTLSTAPSSSVTSRVSTGSADFTTSNEYMRAYTQSPSLGYIPMAFPFDSRTSTTLRQDISISSAPPLSSARFPNKSVHHDAVGNNLSAPAVPFIQSKAPSIPNLNLSSVRDRSSSSRSSTSLPQESSDHSRTRHPKSDSLYDLLYDMTDLSSPEPLHRFPQPFSQPSQFVQNVQTGFSLPLYSSMSFDPSFQTHSTSVGPLAPGTSQISRTTIAHSSAVHSHVLAYPPPQTTTVAYKINMYDLVALTKRVRATSASRLGDSRFLLHRTSIPKESAHCFHLQTPRPFPRLLPLSQMNNIRPLNLPPPTILSPWLKQQQKAPWLTKSSTSTPMAKKQKTNLWKQLRRMSRVRDSKCRLICLWSARKSAGCYIQKELSVVCGKKTIDMLFPRDPWLKQYRFLLHVSYTRWNAKWNVAKHNNQ